MPKITIAIPTYNRPKLLSRCLDKLLLTLGTNTRDFEILVGDDSALTENQMLLSDFQIKWGGACHYLKHSQPLGQQGNFNDLIAHANGQFIQFVHDDDFLLPGAGINLLKAVNNHGDRPEPLLFATVLVNLDEKVIRRERNRSGYLTPQKAVQALISKSSFVRFPAMVVPRSSYLAIGGFDPKDPIPDWPVWLRLAERYGLSVQPFMTNAYTIHEAAGTSKTFTVDYMLYLIGLLSSYQETADWNSFEMQKALGEFINRYVIAGCIRSIKNRDYPSLRLRYELFKNKNIMALPCPGRWILQKYFLGVASRLI